MDEHLTARGVVVSYGTARQRARKCGQGYDNQIPLRLARNTVPSRAVASGWKRAKAVQPLHRAKSPLACRKRSGFWPQAIGVQATYLQHQVISLSGDGGFTMLMGDLLTLVQHELPAKVVLFNNGSLGFVELEMKAAGLLETGVSLVNPDFAAMARAAGLFARRVEDSADLQDAIRAVLAHDEPALLDVVRARQELAVPPKIGVKQATGFGLWVAKAVLGGRGTEVVDLARTNLFR